MYCVKFTTMQTRAKRARERALGVLERPLSDTVIRVCSAEEHSERLHRPGPYTWTGMVYSPMGSWLDLTGHRREWLILREAEDDAGPVARGLVAEMLYAAGLLHEFEELVCGNSIACEHIMRLVSAIDGDSLITEAQALARSSRAKNAAIKILTELNNADET